MARSVHEREVPANVIAARRRAGGAFVAFAGGLWLARSGTSPGAAWCLGGAAVLAIGALLARGWLVRALLALAMVAFGLGWYSLRIESTRRDSLAQVLERGANSPATRAGIEPGDAAPRGVIVCLEGTALDAPEVVSDHTRGLERFLHDGARSRLTMRARALASGTSLIPVSGALRVWIDGETLPGVRAGDAVRVTGVFDGPRGPMNPGAVDRRLLAAQDGAQGSLSLSSPTLVQRLDRPTWWSGLDSLRATFSLARSAMRARARTAVDSMLGEGAGRGLEMGGDESGELVRGLLLGELSNDPEGLRATFTRLGLLHTLCISGFHLAVMAMVTLTLIRLTGDRGWIEPIVVAGLVLGYAMIVPPNSPVLRSALMVLLLLVSEALGRRYDRLTMLFWIGIVVLIVRPLDLWSLGFQLTFGVTGLLYVVVPVFESRLLGPMVFGARPGTVGARQRISRAIRAAFAINVACWAASAPAILFRTGLASPIAVIAGAALGPIVVIVLWLGYVALLLGMVAPPVASWLGVVVRPCATLATWIAATLDRVPWGSMRLPPVSLAWTIVATAAAILWLRRGWWKRTRGWLVASALVLWLTVEWMGVGVPANIATRIDMLSVGDGSCLLVRSGRDAVLWDAGSLTAGLGSRDIPKSLRALGAWRVPTVVVTHPDLDHYGLLPDLVGPLGVRDVVLGQRFLDRVAESPHSPESYLLAELSRRGVRVRAITAGARLSLGSRELVFLSPRAGATYAMDNEHSLVAMVVAHGTNDAAHADAILTGDLARQGIEDVARNWPALRASVLELPHHGSADPRAIEWVGKVSPGVVLQSTGPKRARDVRWAVVRSGRTWLCTAEDGATWAEIGVDGTVRAGGFNSRAGR